MAFTTINTQTAHNAYEQMTIDEQAAIDKAFTAAQKSASRENGKLGGRPVTKKPEASMDEKGKL